MITGVIMITARDHGAVGVITHPGSVRSAAAPSGQGVKSWRRRQTARRASGSPGLPTAASKVSAVSSKPRAPSCGPPARPACTPAQSPPRCELDPGGVSVWLGRDRRSRAILVRRFLGFQSDFRGSGSGSGVRASAGSGCSACTGSAVGFAAPLLTTAAWAPLWPSLPSPSPLPGPIQAQAPPPPRFPPAPVPAPPPGGVRDPVPA